MQSRQRGMSLVEVLVAMAIGLIGIVIIMQAYIASDKFNRSTAGEGSAQTNGTVALFTLERELRNAGYGISNSATLGCGNIYWYYGGQYSGNAGGTLPNMMLAPVYIDNSAGPNQPYKITVMYATTDNHILPTSITGFNNNSSEVTLNGVAGINNQDLVLLVGPSGCTLANITGNPNTVTQKVQVNPGNSGPYNPSAWGSFPTSYCGSTTPKGNFTNCTSETLVDLGNPKVRTYSIVNNNLRVTDTLLQAAGATAMDLVDGIVDLRAQYGVDDGGQNGTVSNPTYGANDGIVDQWTNTQPTTAAQWKQVIAVRIAVLARIGAYEKPVNGACAATTTTPVWAVNLTGNTPNGDHTDSNITVESQSFTVPEGIPSCYRYRVFETIVPLRNVIWAP